MARAARLKEQVVDQVTQFDGEQPEFDTEPVVKTLNDILPQPGMGIRVPKTFGKMWEKRIRDVEKANELEHAIWDKIYTLYRQCGDEGAKFNDEDITYRYRLANATDENIIRTNVRTIMRSTYMQNPRVEYTSKDKEDKLPDTLEYILEYLWNKKNYPGVGMKAHARRWILHGQLTNFGILRLDYQKREGSQQDAIEIITRLEKKLQDKSLSVQKIEDIYAQIQVLYDELPLLEKKGMKLTNVNSECFGTDAGCTITDLSDATWAYEWFDINTDYMHQKYYFRKGGKWVLRANEKVTTEPVVEGSQASDDVRDSVLETVLSGDTEERKKVKAKDTTRCYYVYDKVMRRIYLFNSENWEYPLHIEEDDLKLSRFFRHFVLAFGEPIEGIVQPGEASFYVGQVDEINRVNRKISQIRNSIFGAIIYNKKAVDKNEVVKLIKHLKNPNEVEAFGVGMDPEKKINEQIEVLAPPAMQHKEAFDTSGLRQTIDRIAATTEVDRGGQFKTNTTTDAVAYYEQQKEQIQNVVVDSIEEGMDDIAWAMSEILVSKYSKDEIVELVGAERAEAFQPMTVQEFNQQYRMQLASGSIEKPTSQYKRKEALQIVQGIGQVASAAPMTGLRIMLRVLSNAFTDFNVTEKDWQMLEAEGMANMQKGVSTNAEQGPAEQPK